MVSSPWEISCSRAWPRLEPEGRGVPGRLAAPSPPPSPPPRPRPAAGLTCRALPPRPPPRSPPRPPSPPLPAVTGDQRTPHRSFPFSSLDSWAGGFTVGQGTKEGGLGASRRTRGTRRPWGREPLRGRCVHTGTRRAGRGDTGRPGAVTRGGISAGRRGSPPLRPRVPHSGRQAPSPASGSIPASRP